MAYWFEKYIGLPWAGVPEPPKSFTCGELVRYIYRERFGFDFLPVPVPDARNLKDSLKAMSPKYFGLEQLDEPREFAIAFFQRRIICDHCGLAVATNCGLHILHCATHAGVCLLRLADLKSTGFSAVTWWRHPEVAI